MTISQLVINVFLIVFGVVGGRLIFSSLYKPTTKISNLVSIGIGGLAAAGFYFTWLQTGLDPIQLTICAFNEEAQVCKQRKVAVVPAATTPGQDSQSAALYASAENPVIPSKNANLRASLEAARSIVDPEIKDNTLKNLYLNSLAQNAPDIALLAATETSDENQKSTLLVLLVCSAAALDRIPIAQMSIDQIPIPKQRDRGRAVLAREFSKETKDRSVRECAGTALR